MALNKLSTWFLTDAGKKFTYYATGSVTTAVMLANTLPHTILLDKYKDIIHLYKKGFSVPLTDKLQKRFQKTLDLLAVDERDKHLYKPFAVFGFDVFSAGSSYSQYGAIIGLPANFAYDSIDSVDKSSIRLREDSIIWDLDEGQDLLKSLVLSEAAQMYAMAKEIKFRDTPKPMIDTVVSVVSCVGCYGLSTSFNRRLNLYAKPLVTRVILYCMVGAFSFGSYALCKDASQVYYEEKIDKELIAKNPMFLEGGKEFYTKLLQRNKALRKFLGKEGERNYSVLGNENYFLRQRHLPLIHRLSLFENKSSEHEMA